MPIGLKTSVCDFETASACDLKKAGAWRYAEDPTTEILCFSFELADTGGIATWTPDMGPEHPISRCLTAMAADENVTFIAHNAGFEKAIWRNIMVPMFGFPDIPNSRWHDTMAVCAMKQLPQQLEHAALVLRLPQEKDMGGSALVRSLSKPDRKTGKLDRSPETMEKIYAYCEQDVRTERALHERIGWLQPGERLVWLLDQRINERGVRLDLDFVGAAQSIVDLASEPLAAEFRKLTGGLEFTQVAKLTKWCSDQGAAIPDLKKETLDEILGINEDEEEESNAEIYSEADDQAGMGRSLPQGVRRALEIRQLIGSASVKKLGRMEACVGADGRARGLLQYHGAGPGRWAGRLLQPQNFPRGTVRIGDKAPAPEIAVDAIMTRDPEYVEMTLGPPVETVVSSLRHSIIASPGRVLNAGDFSTIEARIVLSLAGQHDKTELMAKGLDIYNDMATAIYKRPINRKLATDAKEGQVGKNAVLGLGFMMGPLKFQLRYAKDQPIEFCQNVVRTYRKEWAPLVPPLWYGLEAAAVNTVWSGSPHEAYGVRYALEDGWLTARLPSGRKLWYFNPQKVRKPVPWDADDVRKGFTYQAKKMGRWLTISAFGGLLTENVVQALARDLMVAAMFKCEKAGLPIILTVHDEIITEPEKEGLDPLALRQIMCEGTDWSRAMQIPIAAETWIGDRYKK